MGKDTLEEPLKKLTKLKDNLKDLTEEEAYWITKKMLNRELSPARTVMFLTAMRIKGETPQELYGILRALREASEISDDPVEALDVAPNYDGKVKTLYILPSAMMICRGISMEFTLHWAGKTPVKEGVTVVDVLKGMGIEGEIGSIKHQGEFCPDLFTLMPLRKELGFRTFINTVEKLINPFNSRRLVTSVFHKPFFEKIGALLDRLKLDSYTIIKGVEGGIEPFPDRPTFYRSKEAELKRVDPPKGLKLPENVETSDPLGDSVKLNLEIITGRREDEFLNWAIYTASLLILSCGKAEDPNEAIELAYQGYKSLK